MKRGNLLKSNNPKFTSGGCDVCFIEKTKKWKQPGLKFHLKKGQATCICKGRFPWKCLKSMGNFLKGHQGQETPWPLCIYTGLQSYTSEKKNTNQVLRLPKKKLPQSKQWVNTQVNLVATIFVLSLSTYSWLGLLVFLMPKRDLTIFLPALVWLH